MRLFASVPVFTCHLRAKLPYYECGSLSFRDGIDVSSCMSILILGRGCMESYVEDNFNLCICSERKCIVIEKHLFIMQEGEKERVCVGEGVALRSNRWQLLTILHVIHWKKLAPGSENLALKSNESPATCVLKDKTPHFSGSHLFHVRNERLTMVILPAQRLHDPILFNCCENGPQFI